MPDAVDLEIQRRSVTDAPAFYEGVPGGGPWPWAVAGAFAIGAPEWGTAVNERDIYLQQFLTLDSMAAGAVATICARNTGYSWEVSAQSSALREACTRLLRHADLGRGWEHFAMAVGLDYLSQDKGAFVELVRAGPEPGSPLVGIQHLPARDCWSTGRPDEPVIYRDRAGRFHRLRWYQVYRLAEMPMPHPVYEGLQLSAVSRFFRAARVHLNIQEYLEEKTGGRQSRAIHLVQGVTGSELKSALSTVAFNADNAQLQRYQPPIILPVLSDKMPAKVETLELASLPDGFDQEQNYREYLTVLAMALLADFQELAPLPSGNLGTGSQSETLDQKSRQKGAALWRKAIDGMMQNILPEGAEFRFTEIDQDEAKIGADVRKARAEGLKLYVDMGALDALGARAIAVEDGDIPPEVAEDVATREREADTEEEPPEEPFGAPAPGDGGDVQQEAIPDSNDELKALKSQPVHPVRMAVEDDAMQALEDGLGRVFERLRGDLGAAAAEGEKAADPGMKLLDQMSRVWRRPKEAAALPPVAPRRVVRRIIERDDHGRMAAIVEEEA